MNEQEMLSTFRALRISKQKGELDIDDEFAEWCKWRGILDYSTLNECLWHYSEECKLEMLALLVESKKSTLRFTHHELDIILQFLQYNLGEKMEYVPLIKKALKRLKDSLAVMRRQLSHEEKMRNRYNEQNTLVESCQTVEKQFLHEINLIRNVRDYVNFFVNLRLECVSNLYADATYARRRSSLQILLLTQDLYDEFKDILSLPQIGTLLPRHDFQNVEWKQDQVSTIFQCLMLDTYESNKEMEYRIIKSILLSNPALLDLNHLHLFHIALKFADSVRPIDSVTAAYLLKIFKLSPDINCVVDLVFDFYDVKLDPEIPEVVTLKLVLLLHKTLQQTLALAKEKGLGMAIVKNSLYGHLFCIRSLLSDCDLRGMKTTEMWQLFIDKIIKLCFELNRAVSVVVNNSSPEGHLPMDSKTLNLDETLPEKEIITPQMVLLCSWRTVKEVSQLFGLLATEASIQTAESPNGLLTMEQIEKMMKHLVSLLCETKHRGAFEQVYVGFHQLCTRLWQLTDTTLNTLPMRWLHDILIGITGLMPGYTKLCATRRSAGVPFMIQAVLSSEPKIRNNSKVAAFPSVMKILLQFSQLETVDNLRQEVKNIMYRDTNIFSEYEHLTESIIKSSDEYHAETIKLDITEIRIHSMNILRALFRHCQFRNMTKNYIADGFIVAFKNYERTWPERNAATLLFSALMIRTFGVQRTKDHINLTTDNKMTAKIFFDRYPNLLDFILSKLHAFVSIKDIIIESSVQAILLLLSRLYINYHFDGTDIAWINKIVSLVSQCAKSPAHNTRELAARALVSLLTESTAYGMVKKLFLCTARDTRISMNLTHGYLLQIFEILTRLPSVRMQLLKSDVTDFLRGTDWILKGLERRTDEFSCFFIASVYIDILNELYNSDKNMVENCNMEDILYILQGHLVAEDLLRQGPGEQMYKTSVIKFILSMAKYSSFLQKLHNERSNAFIIYSRLLIMPEAEIQSVAWTTVSEILKEDSYPQRKLLSTYAIRIITDFAPDLYKYNPDLQDAIFDFLYNSLMDERRVIDKREICNLVLTKIHLHDANNIYSQRVNYLRLLGKCMTTITRELKDEDLKWEYAEDIYRKVCDNTWIGLLNENFRLSVFDILYELFDKGPTSATLDWWTMLLQLLVDDNVDVRRDASKLICRLEPCNELECFEKILGTFLQKFTNIVGFKYPELAISALFCWGISLLGDMDYEMDETDVFNKCRNYDVFQPVRMAELCSTFMKTIFEHSEFSIYKAIPPCAVKWINYRLGTDFPVESTFKEIIYNYESNMPKLKSELEEFLDPTFKDKLFQVSAFKEYASSLKIYFH